MKFEDYVRTVETASGEKEAAKGKTTAGPTLIRGDEMMVILGADDLPTLDDSASEPYVAALTPESDLYLATILQAIKAAGQGLPGAR